MTPSERRAIKELEMNYKKIATGISWVLHPFLLPVYLMAVLLTMTAFSHYPPNVKFYLLWVVALYAIVIPLLSLGCCARWAAFRTTESTTAGNASCRCSSGPSATCCGAITIAKIPSAIFLRKFMVAAACCEVLCLVVSFYWKISLHLTGMGAVVALLVVMNVVGVGNMLVPLMVAILCAGALASARLYLGCHNGWQVLAGFCGGFAVSVLAVLFL